ncbi:MAG TPA: FtsX-like permease family protein [Steroidobacteraceae bacterium]|jgi:putative ABC transport system permease protein|nr:FtsX-like permease family protein [Steroidobacteraceae bacterium]
MKYLPLVWAGIWRKGGRTILIFLQVAVAFTLFGVLQGLKTGVDHAIGAARADLLIVHSRLSFGVPLPVGMLETIRSVPGVAEAIPVDLTGATYQNPKQQMALVAIRPDPGWVSAFTYTVSPSYVKAFRALRTGALVNVELAKKYGWKVGDRIPLMTFVAQQGGSTVWTFDVVGTFADADIGSQAVNILINYDYWNEARASGKDTVNHFNVRITDPTAAAAMSDAIDARFANSPNETRTESIREMAQESLQSIGDLEFLIRAVVAAVLAALLFATATMMMQSVRERTSEIAVLKTVGFTDGAVFALTLTESAIVCVAAGGAGLAVASLAFPYASKFVHGLSMPLIIIILGLLSALAVALISAAIPAALAARLEVATALAER